MIEDTVRVYIRHIRAAKFCASGGRTWFNDHGYSWTDFLENGILATTLEATQDEMALVVCKLAREEATNGGQ